jgi:hypothetical protein
MIPRTKAETNCIIRCFMFFCTSFMCIVLLFVSYITGCIIDDAFWVYILKGGGLRAWKSCRAVFHITRRQWI